MHYPPLWIEKLALPELENMEVQIHTYESFTCVAVVDYDNGQALAHVDIGHDSRAVTPEGFLRKTLGQLAPTF